MHFFTHNTNTPHTTFKNIFFQENLNSYMSHSMLIMNSYSLFQLIMTYRIIFWGSSSHSQKSFKTQKTAVRIIMRHKILTLVELIQKILPLKSKYIFSLLLFVVNNKALIMTNSENHYKHTRQSNNLHLLLANLTVYQQTVHNSGTQFCNKPPLEIKRTARKPSKFKPATRKFLNTHSPDTLAEFYNT
jgi:hypothetical protein